MSDDIKTIKVKLTRPCYIKEIGKQSVEKKRKGAVVEIEELHGKELIYNDKAEAFKGSVKVESGK